MDWVKFYLLLVLFFNISCTGYGQEKRLDSLLNSITPEQFSGAILVAKDNLVLYTKAYGFSNIEHSVPNSTETMFNIASITKMISAVAILQLVEKSIVDLYTPIGAYLPSYPNRSVKDSVTIHHLLTHTSGLNNFYVESEYTNSNKLDFKSVSDFIPLFSDKSLLSAPGKQYKYGASGFIIVGLIIEEMTGQSYYEYVERNILIPSEMYNTMALEVDAIQKNKASGYTTWTQSDESLRKNEYYLSKSSPGGFYYSTVSDLFKFSRQLRGFKLLSRETTELMFKPKVKGYNTHLGYGIDIDLRYNQTIQGHSGGWYGIRGELMDFMDDNYTVIILSNIDDNGETGTTKLSNDIKMIIGGKIKE